MNRYLKSEKLKSRKSIKKLFVEGKALINHPVRMIFVPLDENDAVSLKIGVSVSKRYHKHAVDRNYYKRVLRECYRKNQHILKDSLKRSFAVMLVYQSKSKYKYPVIEQKVIELFRDFSNRQA